MMTSLIVSSSLITAGCRTEAVRGVVVGRFVDEQPMAASVLIPASNEAVFPIYVELRQSDTVCLLSGEIREGIVPLFDICEGASGSGNISCNDGRTLKLEWTLSSCQGGNGRSTNSVGSRFFFGFDLTGKKALDQLTAAQQASEKTE